MHISCGMSCFDAESGFNLILVLTKKLFILINVPVLGLQELLVGGVDWFASYKPPPLYPQGFFYKSSPGT